MSTPFDRLERMASQSIDRLNAKPATWTPLVTRPNGRSRPDPERSPMSIRGVLDLRQRPAGIEIGNRESREANDFRLKRVGPSLEFSLDVRQLGGRSAPRQGDRLEIDGQRYEITSAHGDGTARVILALVEA